MNFVISDGDLPDDGQSSELLIDEECQEDMPDGVYELTHETLRLLDMPNAFPHELDDGFKFDRGWWEWQV